MLPDREINSDATKTSADNLDQDPYLVSLASNTRTSKRQSENIRAVVDEMQGTALRRRTQLLKGGH
jgi:hypothetical protein